MTDILTDFGMTKEEFSKLSERVHNVLVHGKPKLNGQKTRKMREVRETSSCLGSRKSRRRADEENNS